MKHSLETRMRFSESEVGFQTLQLPVQIEWSIALLVNAIVSEKITFF